MHFRVVMTPSADADVDDAFACIHQRSPRNADRWLAGLEEAFRSLRRFPKRGARAPESQFLQQDLRQLVYKSHRIIYRVEPGVVRVLFVRHAARRPVGDPEAESNS